MLRPRLLHALVSVLLALVLAPGARAADSWSDPLPGVKRLHRQTSTQNMNALVVNLCAAGVSMRATAYGERGKKTSTFGALVGAQAAINGDFFGSGYSTNGVSAHDGQTWGAADHGYVGPIAFGANKADLVAHEVVAGPEAWMKEIVSGHPTILWGGQQRNNNGDSLCTVRHPRTAVGLSQDRRTLYMVVVDGRKPNRLGFTCDELSAFLKELGAWDGMNLDGGGSSTMWMGGSIINYPSDSTGERVVGNHLALYAKGSGDAAHCPIPDFRAEFVGAGGWPGGTSMTLEAGAEVEGYLDYKNTGAKNWIPGVTKLGTTQPRDHAAAWAHESWEGPNRLATVDKEVKPGEVGRFTFSVRAPKQEGTYKETFNLVQEAVTWFSDSGGPGDDVSWMSVTSVAPKEPPPASGGAGGEAGAPSAGAAGAGGAESGGSGGAILPAGGTGGYSADGPDQKTRVIGDDGGCAVSRARAASSLWLVGAALAALGARRRRQGSSKRASLSSASSSSYSRSTSSTR